LRNSLPRTLKHRHLYQVLRKRYWKAWNDIGDKLIAMAEDFPESKYDFKATLPERPFAEVLL